MLKRKSGLVPAPEASFSLGTFRSSPSGEEERLRIVCEAPELALHAGKPWLRAWLSERLSLPLMQEEANGFSGSRGAQVDAALLCRHSLVCGATGSGKTRLALHLIDRQLHQGCSVVMLDPKAETLRHVMELAYSAGIPAERVTLLSPRLSGTGAPGWNPLGAEGMGLSVVQAATDFVSVLARSSTSWGPRLQDVLTNALILIGAHGLSLYELARLLQRDDYRAGLLRHPPPALSAGDRLAFLEARDFFVQEFGRWSKSEQAGAVAPVLNKFREFLRNTFLRSLLCARRQTLDFASLWQTPGLVLVHLDAPSLGDEGARLLGGLLTHHLYRTALRAEGRVPVVLALDEMGVSEQFLGSALSQMLAIARSHHLRLLVACQHLAQLSDSLRTALLSACAVKAFFRLGYDDARIVAASLSAGSGERISRIAVDVTKRDREGKPAEFSSWAHPVLDACGNFLKLSEPAWIAFLGLKKQGDGDRQLEGLRRVAQASGMERLYVRAPDSRCPVELCRYVQGLNPNEYAIEGPFPVRLVVAFPRPKASVVSRTGESERQQQWTKTLQGLAVRQAVLKLASQEPGVIQVAAVPDPQEPPGLARFLSEAMAVNGQTDKDLEEALLWRRQQVEDVAGGDKEAADSAVQINRKDAGKLPRRPPVPAMPSPTADEAEPPARRAHSEKPTGAEDGSLA